jgi:amidase
MGTSVSTLKLVFKSLLSTEPWLHDPDALPIPWRGDREFRMGSQGYLPAFGFMPHDGIVAPHPPISRALNTVRAALIEAGLEVLDWEPPSYNESIEIHVS